MTLWRILRMPLAVFLATAGGLAAALLGDGWWHWLSWLLLAIPPVIITAAWVRQPRTR
ncbi:MAG TPA: hypothetical protein VHC40_10140 [Rhizomicrobium sp.]|jgi:hypothetical protein|nr:hypothetical protein [Rhizomicrobium sp.]